MEPGYCQVGKGSVPYSIGDMGPIIHAIEPASKTLCLLVQLMPQDLSKDANKIHPSSTSVYPEHDPRVLSFFVPGRFC